jgi:hypothetical protein
MFSDRWRGGSCGALGAAADRLINGAIFPNSDDSMARAPLDLKLPLEVDAQLFAPFGTELTRNRHKIKLAKVWIYSFIR